MASVISISSLRNNLLAKGLVTKLPVCGNCGKQVPPREWNAHIANCAGPGGVKAWRLDRAA